MNIAAAGIRERLNSDGYSPLRFAAILLKLTIGFVAFVALILGSKVIDYFVRFRGRPLSMSMLEAFARSVDARSLFEMWLMFGLVAALLAVVVNGVGWRSRRPRLSSWLVRLGVFAGVLISILYREIPAHFHASPVDHLYVFPVILLSGLIVGFVVESAKLGVRSVTIFE